MFNKRLLLAWSVNILAAVILAVSWFFVSGRLDRFVVGFVMGTIASFWVSGFFAIKKYGVTPKTVFTESKVSLGLVMLSGWVTLSIISINGVIPSFISVPLLLVYFLFLLLYPTDTLVKNLLKKTRSL